MKIEQMFEKPGARSDKFKTNPGGETMGRLYVTVNCDQTADGRSIPRSIKWDESRSSAVRRVLHICTSPKEYEGIRYTILIGSAEKYLYKVGDKWYVELQE